jgi:hypothetical protein
MERRMDSGDIPDTNEDHPLLDVAAHELGDQR